VEQQDRLARTSLHEVDPWISSVDLPIGDLLQRR